MFMCILICVCIGGGAYCLNILCCVSMVCIIHTCLLYALRVHVPVLINAYMPRIAQDLIPTAVAAAAAAMCDMRSAFVCIRLEFNYVWTIWPGTTATHRTHAHACILPCIIHNAHIVSVYSAELFTECNHQRRRAASHLLFTCLLFKPTHQRQYICILIVLSYLVLLRWLVSTELPRLRSCRLLPPLCLREARQRCSLPMTLTCQLWQKTQGTCT